jgi:hypothetical protein
MYGSAYADLPPRARAEQRDFWSTPRHARSVRDEFSEIRTTMNQARSLTTLGDTPLLVLTAEKNAEGGWTAAQNDLTKLSTNSDHELLPDATHSMLLEDQDTAALSSQAIERVVDAASTKSARTG